MMERCRQFFTAGCDEKLGCGLGPEKMKNVFFFLLFFSFHFTADTCIGLLREKRISCLLAIKFSSAITFAEEFQCVHCFCCSTSANRAWRAYSMILCGLWIFHVIECRIPMSETALRPWMHGALGVLRASWQRLGNIMIWCVSWRCGTTHMRCYCTEENQCGRTCFKVRLSTYWWCESYNWNHENYLRYFPIHRTERHLFWGLKCNIKRFGLGHIATEVG